MINYNNYCLAVQSSILKLVNHSFFLTFLGPLLETSSFDYFPIFLRIGRVRVFFIFVGILYPWPFCMFWMAMNNLFLEEAILIMRLLDLVSARLVFETVIWGFKKIWIFFSFLSTCGVIGNRRNCFSPLCNLSPNFLHLILSSLCS